MGSEMCIRDSNINNKKIRYTIVYLPDNPKKKGRGAERKRKSRGRSIKKGKTKG